MIATTTLIVNAKWLTLASVLIPLAVGISVKSSLASKHKAIVMLSATAAAALIQQIVSNNGILTSDTFTLWVQATVLTVTAYYGVYKPVGVGNLLPNAGIGAVDPETIGGV